MSLKVFKFAVLLVLGFAPSWTVMGQLVITEVMSGSAHPPSDPITGLGGLANGDWFELANKGPTPIDMTGYLWDDNQRLAGWPSAGFTRFPDNFVIQPFEAVLIVEESRANVDHPEGWRAAWGVPSNIRILSRTDMLGPDTFSGLSGTNGDEVNIYDPNRNLVTGVSFPPVGTLGFSFEWDASGTFLNFSVIGENGAYRALSDGSQNPPPYPALDVASPGIYVRPGITGDFNGDGFYNCLDVDALVGVIAAGTNVSSFDLTGDGQVNRQDLDAWLVEGGNINVGAPYKYGDANLDGSVTQPDFAIWFASRFTSTARWCAGDFNADGQVDGSDHGLWNANKTPATESVPEPNAILLGLGMILCVWSRRGR